MTGLVLAGAFFIFKLDDYFKELNFYKNVARTFQSDSKRDETTVKYEDAQPAKEKKVKEIAAKNNEAPASDSVKTTLVNNNSDAADSLA